MNVPGELYRFAIVGTVGFIVDASVLQILVSWFGVGLLTGRIFSYLAAATITWFLHRIYTFRDQLSATDDHATSSHALLNQWFRFIMTNGFGAVLNYGIYAVLILSFELCRAYPAVAVAIGSLVAMVFNFAISRRFVFSGNPQS